MAAIPYPRSANLTTYNGSDQITRAGQLLVALFLMFDDPVDLRLQVFLYKHLLRQLHFSFLDDVDCVSQTIGSEIGCLFADADNTPFLSSNMSPWFCPNQITTLVMDDGQTRFFMCFLPKLGPVKAGPFLFNKCPLLILNICGGYTSGLRGCSCLTMPLLINPQFKGKTDDLRQIHQTFYGASFFCFRRNSTALFDTA